MASAKPAGVYATASGECESRRPAVGSRIRAIAMSPTRSRLCARLAHPQAGHGSAGIVVAVPRWRSRAALHRGPVVRYSGAAWTEMRIQASPPAARTT